MTGITKRFGSNLVLESVDFDVLPGEVNVLAGENGAGKSTLIKILGGVLGGYEGRIEVNGKHVAPVNAREANALGVAVIHQELSLAPNMSVVDNLFLGSEPLAAGGFVSRSAERRRCQELLDNVGLDLEPDTIVDRLPIAARQLLEIAKALRHDAKVIVMDEPTSALSAPEVEKLFGLIGRLKSEGCGIVYITHKMEEIGRLADRITVLRDGKLVGVAPIAEMSPAKLVQLMVGTNGETKGNEAAVPTQAQQGVPPRFEIRNVSVAIRGRKLVDDVSLSVQPGEVLGLGGLQGSGASELLMGLFGGNGPVPGAVLVDGEKVVVRSPAEAIRKGIALLTNDRKTTGLVLPMSVTFNTALADLPRLCPGGIRRIGREKQAAERHAKTLSLRAHSLDMAAGELSGGNQQKVALAKWLQTSPKVLLLDEPTRGIDIGAKRDIYKLIREWTKAGMAILLITSELPELLELSDRIVVMHRGRVTAEFDHAHATPDGVIQAAMGVREQETA